MRLTTGAILIVLILLAVPAACSEPDRPDSDRANPSISLSRPNGQTLNAPDPQLRNDGEPLDNSAHDANTSSSSSDIERFEWPFAPVRLRVHPLTRFWRAENNQPSVLEVHVEFFDQFGHNTKGTGRIRFELYPIEPGLPGHQRVGGRINVWEVDLTDLENNVLHYDDVTRTYFFRLELERELISTPQGRLLVTLVTGQSRMDGEFTLSYQ